MLTRAKRETAGEILTLSEVEAEGIRSEMAEGEGFEPPIPFQV